MDTLNEVKKYYGTHINTTDDLKTDACCTINKYPQNILKLLNNINNEILSTYYGCGLTIPDCLDNCNILDLGCGTGRDIYLLSQLVSENGSVIGIDMTKEQLEIANRWKEWHMAKFNYKKTNVEFKEGYIEYLDKLNILDNSIDIVISNCVINLSPNKRRILKQIYRVLKTGGEFYFSDIYSSKRIPDYLKNDSVLWGECLSGALYWNDFLNLAKECGFKDIRLVKYNKINIKNNKLEEKLNMIDFYSATYRLFKLPELLESDCEDYGQAVIYKGTIENHKHFWELDSHHKMYTNKVFPVCGNTWNMLKETRFKNHFEFIGNFDTHYGIFSGCGKNMPFHSNNQSDSNLNSNPNSNCC